MMTSRSAAAARPDGAAPRRRGPVLERAILEAALDQLSSVGWNGLTMERVALGAQTGKAAVYRRWPSKEDLVADALQAGLPRFDEAPDLGDVREELYELCCRVRDVMNSRPGLALRAVLHECDEEAAVRFRILIETGVVGPSKRLFAQVLERGVARGEVRPGALDDLVLDVIPALMMYRSKVCGSEWTDAEMADVIDRIMVPLVRSTPA
ncbi:MULTISPECIES: TetR/AcrR family transcriptional regulator [Streptomyces]|uniref:TetR/AcrR family transcriptional regulator n=2 Tax=Streptomyces TaxID=1883 RepID=A0ABU4K4C7_9ACTN|nr:TetR/AcrR family transcriptional regulator [Streptomyces roseolus]MDX2292285.1 TetR/AcrR family transcriptional regulator [Streptomyces roseolus]